MKHDGGSAFFKGWGGTRLVLLPLIILVSACSHKPEPIVRTVTVKVPVAIECVPATLDPTPSYPDTDEALRSAYDAAERYALVAAGRLLRDARLAELEGVVLACREVKQ